MLTLLFKNRFLLGPLERRSYILVKTIFHANAKRKSGSGVPGGRLASARRRRWSRSPSRLEGGDKLEVRDPSRF